MTSSLPNETTSPPPVAFLARNLVLGGAERAFLNLVNHAERVSPEVVLLRRRGGLLGELSPLVAMKPLDGSTLGGRLSIDRLEEWPLGSSAQLMLEVHRLARVIDTSGARVVSSFLMRAHVVALLTKLLLRPHLHVVINIHEQMSESARYLYPNLRDRIAMRWITRHLFRRADRIIVVAKELRRDLTDNFALPPASIETIYNPVDLARIRRLSAVPGPNLFGDQDSAPTICAVGRLVPLKGYDLLLRALAELRKKLPARLVIVGDGPSRPELQSLTNELGLAPFVHFTGWDGNPWRHLVRADVLALSSRTEAFPSVISEAFALGVPVVASECSAGVRECVDDGRAALLVPPESPTALAQALERVLVDGVLRRTLAQAGERFAETFDLPITVRRYEDVLLDVLRRGRRQPFNGEATPAPTATTAW